VILNEAIEAIKAEAVVAPDDDSVEVAGCFAADLMSDVLAFAQTDSILISGLATDQTIRTAAIKQLAAVVIVEGKTVDGEMMDAAEDEAVPVYRTPLSKYEVCGLLIEAGLRPYRKGALPKI